MEAQTEKPNKRTRARNRAVSRLAKALDLAQNASIDAELAKMPHATRMGVVMAHDAIKAALKAIFDAAEGRSKIE